MNPTPETSPISPAQPPAQPSIQPSDPYAQQFIDSLHPSDEIIINNGNDQTSSSRKKLLLIGGIVALALIIIVAIIGVALSNNPFSNIASTQNTSQSPARTSTLQALEAYGAALDDWDPNSAKSTSDLKSLYDQFYTLAQSDPAFSEILNQLKSYQDLFDFAIFLSPIAEPDFESFLSEYLIEGYDNTLSSLETNYDSQEAPEELQSYLTSMYDYYATLLDAFEIYEQDGCIVDGTADTPCAAISESNNPDLFQARKETYAAMMSSTQYRQLIFDSLKNSYKQITEVLDQNES